MDSKFLLTGLTALMMSCGTPQWYTSVENDVNLPEKLTDRKVYEYIPDKEYQIFKGREDEIYSLPPDETIVRIGDTLNIDIRLVKKPVFPVYYDTNGDGSIDVITYHMLYQGEKRSLREYPLLVQEFFEGELKTEYLSHAQIKEYPKEMADKMAEMKRFRENWSITTIEYIISYND